MEPLINLLRKRFPFFEGELLLEIEKNGIIQEIETEENLLSEGQIIKSFPIVLEGSLRIVRTNPEGHELLLYYLHPGEVCSMALTCCMGRQKSNINVIAEQKSLILRIPEEYLEKWLLHFPAWKSFIMYAYRQKFDELLDTIDSIAFLKMDQRLEKFFQNRFKATGEKIFKGKQQDIAYQLNTSREVISRLLKKMEQKQLIIISRNRIDFSALIQAE